MQHVFGGKIVGVLAAAGQKTQILDAFDRATDEGVPPGWEWSAHMTMVASRLISVRATLSAASADVFGLLRDGLP